MLKASVASCVVVRPWRDVLLSTADSGRSSSCPINRQEAESEHEWPTLLAQLVIIVLHIYVLGAVANAVVGFWSYRQQLRRDCRRGGGDNDDARHDADSKRI